MPLIYEKETQKTAQDIFRTVRKRIIWLKTILHCDWLRAGQFIFNS